MIEKLEDYIREGNISALKELMEKENLEISNGKLISKSRESMLSYCNYWDQIQLIRKIQLNSLYGAATNFGSENFDQRLGQSCTLTGRCTTRHMGSHINEQITGKYELGEAVKYGDTDSIYFSIPKEYRKEELTRDNFVEIATTIAKNVNESFPEFFKKTFNVPEKNTKGVIKCGREICSYSTLFIKKKRYASLYYIDDKNIRYDRNDQPGSMKIMGLDTKRSDCPVWVQDKLENTIFRLLAERPSEDEILDFIRDWRQEFSNLDVWKLGSPKRVNNLTHYNNVFKSGTKGITIPGHVRASINWNAMLDLHHDLDSMRIMDGQKVIVCKLKKNKFAIDSIAYPIDQQFLPDWFKKLPFDKDAMVDVNVDQKVKNIFGILGWDLQRTKQSAIFQSLFTFE